MKKEIDFLIFPFSVTHQLFLHSSREETLKLKSFLFFNFGFYFFLRWICVRVYPYEVCSPVYQKPSSSNEMKRNQIIL